MSAEPLPRAGAPDAPRNLASGDARDLASGDARDLASGDARDLASGDARDLASSGPRGGSRGVLDACIAWKAEGVAHALVVVARTGGSTYRKGGAIAAIAADGRAAGSLSGGCLEPAVEALAREAMAAAAPRACVLDTTRAGDLVFGSGSGCRGSMSVVALPAIPCAAAELVDDAWSAGRGAVLDLAVLAPGLGMDDRVVVRAPPRLLILGAGPSAPPLLRVARLLGWWCALGDHRAGLLARRSSGADAVIEAWPEDALRRLEDRVDAAVVMTHRADADLRALGALAGSPVPHVALLGPPSRRDELLAMLPPPQRDALAPRLRAPAGLRLGGDGPEAIALSIAAELQSLLA